MELPQFLYLALVGSLKKDVSAREKQALQLAAEVDKLRQDVSHKDAKLTSMMDKVPASLSLSTAVEL